MAGDSKLLNGNVCETFVVTPQTGSAHVYEGSDLTSDIHCSWKEEREDVDAKLVIIIYQTVLKTELIVWLKLTMKRVSWHHSYTEAAVCSTQLQQTKEGQ